MLLLGDLASRGFHHCGVGRDVVVDSGVVGFGGEDHVYSWDEDAKLAPFLLADLE